MWYKVMMVEREVDEDLGEGGGEDLSVSGRQGDDFDLPSNGCEGDDLPSYFATRVYCCFYCWYPVDKDDNLNERRLGSWNVPICAK